MVGVTDVAAHRDAEQLAAEVVLKPGSVGDLLPVEEYSGPMKPTTVLTSSGRNLRATA
ncbi:MAG: hypothetical protein R3A46_10375 [Thermomicrobiales bacterium]